MPVYKLGGVEIKNDVGNPVPVSPLTGNITVASNQSITAAGVHQQVFAANANRKYLFIQNVDDTDMLVGIGYNPTNLGATPGILLAPRGGALVFENGFVPTQEIRILCANAARKFVAHQYPAS